MPCVHFVYMQHLLVRLHIHTHHRCGKVRHNLVVTCKYSPVSFEQFIGDLSMHWNEQDLQSSTLNSCIIQQRDGME